MITVLLGHGTSEKMVRLQLESMWIDDYYFVHRRDIVTESHSTSMLHFGQYVDIFFATVEDEMAYKLKHGQITI